MPIKLSELDWEAVREHYVARELIHRKLRKLFEAEEVEEYVQLALGISDAYGNFSASEHMNGDKILNGTDTHSVFELARAIDECPTVNHLPGVIYGHDILNLKISIGSEMAMLLRPAEFWVGNTKTFWAHLLIRNQFNLKKANEALRLCLSREDDSEIDYKVWQHLYLGIGVDLLELGRLATEAAKEQNVRPGTIKYLWPDAVAALLFDKYAKRR